MNFNFYIAHWTTYDHLEDILKSGVLFANKYLEEKHIRLAGWERLPYIYTNIIFDDQAMLRENKWGLRLVFHPELFYKQPSIFHEGQMVHPGDYSIYTSTNEGIEHINNNLSIIRKELDELHPRLEKENPQLLRVRQGLNSHELLFLGRIPIKDYIIGITCPACEEKYVKEIRLWLNKYLPGNKVKIITGELMPNFSELVNYNQ